MTDLQLEQMEVEDMKMGKWKMVERVWIDKKRMSVDEGGYKEESGSVVGREE